MKDALFMLKVCAQFAWYITYDYLAEDVNWRRVWDWVGIALIVIAAIESVHPFLPWG